MIASVVSIIADRRVVRRVRDRHDRLERDAAEQAQARARDVRRLEIDRSTGGARVADADREREVGRPHAVVVAVPSRPARRCSGGGGCGGGGCGCGGGGCGGGVRAHVGGARAGLGRLRRGDAGASSPSETQTIFVSLIRVPLGCRRGKHIVSQSFESACTSPRGRTTHCEALVGDRRNGRDRIAALHASISPGVRRSVLSAVAERVAHVVDSVRRRLRTPADQQRPQQPPHRAKFSTPGSRRAQLIASRQRPDLPDGAATAVAYHHDELAVARSRRHVGSRVGSSSSRSVPHEVSQRTVSASATSAMSRPIATPSDAVGGTPSIVSAGRPGFAAASPSHMSLWVLK